MDPLNGGRPSVLLVQGDAAHRTVVADHIRDLGYCVAVVTPGNLLAAGGDTPTFDVAIVELDRPTPSTLGCTEVINAVTTAVPSAPIIVVCRSALDLLTCQALITAGVASIVDAIDGPPLDTLSHRLRQAVGRNRAERKNGDASTHHQIFDETGFAGRSRRMAELLLQAKRVARVSDVPILIEGESGTGKQLLAESIHRLDPKRSSKPFVAINCAAITGTLAESALFGHRRGAFTGATEERLGCFRAADGGTLFLDEIGELCPELQPKLLRALQEGAVLPVGADREIPIDVRVIAATNCSLDEMVLERRFRLDLYQRLNVVLLRVPPIRERADDVPELVDHFVRKYQNYYPTPIREIDPRVYDAVAAGVGEGNVREIENLVRRVLALKRAGDRIDLTDLPREFMSPNGDMSAERDAAARFLADVARRLVRRGNVPLRDAVDGLERLLLEETLRAHADTHEALADRLGLTRRTFYNKLRKYRLAPEQPE